MSECSDHSACLEFYFRARVSGVPAGLCAFSGPQHVPWAQFFGPESGRWLAATQAVKLKAQQVARTLDLKKAHCSKQTCWKRPRGLVGDNTGNGGMFVAWKS
jgi:hypothetical protein